ncbi:MAG TPA: hypothetical protein VFF89_09845 [Sphingobium sp.]|nr:hypothetical protein [Sphingobium sp.]
MSATDVTAIRETLVILDMHVLREKGVRRDVKAGASEAARRGRPGSFEAGMR